MRKFWAGMLTGALTGTLKGTIAAAAFLCGSAAFGQSTPDYTVFEDNPIKIATYGGLSADDWSARFIALAQSDQGVSADKYSYEPDDLESMRLYIFTKLEDLSIDLTDVINRFDAKAHELEDSRNIKIAAMLQAFLKAQSETLSIPEFEARISEITRPYARDNDWFVVFYANSLNFEAVLSQNSDVFDPIIANFAEFSLKGHESDLDYDEARLIYLRMRLYDHLRMNDLSGYFDVLQERNIIKSRFGLPGTNFADLINAASLHHAIFSDPSTIRIAEEAFHSDDQSNENVETGKYILASLYTAHGFADKALEVYGDIDLAALGGDEALIQVIDVEKAFNYILLGDFEEGGRLLAGTNEAIVGDYVAAKIHGDLLNMVMHEQVMTPEKKADILTARQSFHNATIMNRLDMRPESGEQLFAPRGISIAVNKTQAMNSGNLEDLQPVSDIDQTRIQSFIKLAYANLGGSSRASAKEKLISGALNSYSAGKEKVLTEQLRSLRDLPGMNGLAEVFEHYRSQGVTDMASLKSDGTDPELQTLEHILIARSCLKTGDYPCSWAQVYNAKKQARSVGKSTFLEFLISDLELSLMSHENNASAVLMGATDLFERHAGYIADPDMAYDIVNRVAGTFERIGLTGTAQTIVTLDGQAGMGQPYANHMTEVRLMLALSKFREARDRLDTLIVEGSPLRQTLYEKSLSYAARAALGETDEALELAQQVRAGSRGLKDPLLAGLVEPYLLMGDYHVYTHYRPFEAEQYRVKYLSARRLEDAAENEKARLMAEARVRALNASEMRALEKATGQLEASESRASTYSRLAIILAALLGALGIIWARLRRSQKTLAAERQELDQIRQTHEYFMGEMERQTELETTALGAVMDTLTRSTAADPTLIAQKVGDHAGRLRETVARLAFQDRVFTGTKEPRTKLDIEDMTASMSAHFQDMASRKDVSLHFDIHERVRTIHTQKALLSEALRTFVDHALAHTSCDVIEISLRPLAYKDQTYLRTVITDEGDGLAKFDRRLTEGDISPDLAVRLTEAETRGFSADTVIMAINKAGGRFESEAAPGFGHTLTFDMPATLLGAEIPPTPNNIIEFKKGTANDG